MIALFARSNHPQGYGFGGGAHGYVVVGVRCRTSAQRDRVVQHIANEGFDLPDAGRTIYPDGVPEHRYARMIDMYNNCRTASTGEHILRWYSGGPGDWDYLFTVKGNAVEFAWPTLVQYGSRGDNRFTLVYEAKEVLAAKPGD